MLSPTIGTKELAVFVIARSVAQLSDCTSKVDGNSRTPQLFDGSWYVSVEEPIEVKIIW
jgi:hypothetical protein